MDKKTKRIIIIGSIITFIVVPAITALVLSRANQKPAVTTTQPKTQTLPNRSNEELMAAITSSDSTLIENNKPTFTITTVKKPETGWYVVTLRLLSDTDGMNPAKVLLQDSNTTGLQLLLGPGTNFPSDTTQPLGIPSTVLKELNA